MRTQRVDEVLTLDHVITNIINDLEHLQQTPQDDLVIQALIALQTAARIR